MAKINCPVCKAELERGAVCPACGWDTTADPEFHPTLFSAAGTAARKIRGEEAERKALFIRLGESLFSGFSTQALRKCAKEKDHAAAVRRLLNGMTTAADTRWQKNILRSGKLFVPSEDCGQVEIIRFRDTKSDQLNQSWDLSQAKDGSVMAYLHYENSGLVLTVCGEGGVCAPEDSYDLFRGFSRLRTVDFGGCFHTKGCRSMSYMFSNCTALTELDLSDFDTAEVTDMRSMFSNCTALTELDLSSFDTTQVQNMSFMFFSCRSLRRLELGTRFDLANSACKTYLFYGCSALENPPIPTMSIS